MSVPPANENLDNKDCFVIMPIADPDGYDKGHFRKVYEDIFVIACNNAGFKPIRADQVKQTNLIHLDILQKLIQSPMAICDLSHRNPNVLFELGLRQAFDKPTVLVQEVGTPQIFDIAPMRYTEYRRELKYREVLEDQQLIADALKATKEAEDRGDDINSIVKLLTLTNPASLKDLPDNNVTQMFQILMSEMNSLKLSIKKGTKFNLQKERLNARKELVQLELENFQLIIKQYDIIRMKQGAHEEILKLYEVLSDSFLELLTMEISREVKDQIKAQFKSVTDGHNIYLRNIDNF